MLRINVVGTSGSGKSTVSQRLAQALKVPYIEMDRLFWKPDWAEPEDDEFFADLNKALQADAWVLDGNYSRTSAIKWPRTQIVVWVDYSFTRTLYQAVQRAIKRIVSGKELWPGTGNVETFSKTFLSRV